MTGPATGVLTCTSGSWLSTRDAERGFREAAIDDEPWTAAATVFVPADVFGSGEVAVVTAADPRLLPDGARLFRGAGLDAVPAEATVAEVVAGTPVDAVVALGARADVATAGPGRPLGTDVVDTRSFLRPLLEDGLVVLRVRPGREGRWTPFEQPDPTPCCADHP